MFIAIDELGYKTPIEQSSPLHNYKCPLCDAKLIRKMGTINAHHFAHIIGSGCDPWYNDMSEWHRNWQSIFPHQNQEEIVEYNGQYHIADIGLGKMIIEVQHSSISIDELKERQKFYQSAKGKLMWIVDCFGKSIYIESSDRDSVYLVQVHGSYRLVQGSITYFRWDHCKRSFMSLFRDVKLDLFLHVNDDCIIQVLENKAYSIGQFLGRVFSLNSFLKEICTIEESNINFQNLNVFRGFADRLRRQYDIENWKSWNSEAIKQEYTNVINDIDQMEIPFKNYLNKDISYEELKKRFKMPFSRPSCLVSYFNLMDSPQHQSPY